MTIFSYNFNYSYMSNFGFGGFGLTGFARPNCYCCSPMNSIFSFMPVMSFMQNYPSSYNSYPPLSDSLGLTNTSNAFGYSRPAQFNNFYNPFSELLRFSAVTRPNFSDSSYVKESSKSNNIEYNTKTKLPQFKDINYNKEKAQELTQTALRDAYSKSTGYCAKSVKEAIKNTNLGEYIQGDAYQCADILRSNPNFKEINVKGKELSNLPAGCVIVYPRGDADYSKDAGHIEITTGDGRAVSDFVNNSIKASDNASVFVPVNIA